MWFLHELIFRPVIRAYSKTIHDRTYKVSRLMRLLSWVEFKLRPFKPTRLELFLWTLPWKLYLLSKRTRTYRWVCEYLDLHFIIWLDSPDGNSGRTLVWFPSGNRRYKNPVEVCRWRDSKCWIERLFNAFWVYPGW